jgi:hypothetical protein
LHLGEEMSLIKRIQACGLCCCECQSISYKEAEAIKELVLNEVIMVVSRYIYKDTICDGSALTEEEKTNNRRIEHLIKDIQEIK